MNGLTYTPEAYRNILRMTNRKFLLVEGISDKRIFETLIDLLVEKGELDPDIKISIDTAECLIGFTDKLGNREKVEAICASVYGMAFEKKLVGFVDREFRQFHINDVNIQDNLKKHNVQGRLVWSRGHSIENYFIDTELLRVPLKDLGTVAHANDAIKLFEEIFEQAIQIACAASIAALKLDKLKMIRGKFDWTVFDIADNKLTVNFDRLHKFLISKKIVESDIAIIIAKYSECLTWTIGHPHDLLRWICDGHLTLHLIWQIYSVCAVETANSQASRTESSIANSAVLVNQDIRTNGCARQLAIQTFTRGIENPKIAIDMLTS